MDSPLRCPVVPLLPAGQGLGRGMRRGIAQLSGLFTSPFCPSRLAWFLILIHRFGILETHRPDFPAPVPVSPRCYRWWASEVEAFADGLRRKRPDQSAGGGGIPRATKPRVSHPAMPPRRITGKVRAARARKEAP
jgi:hypothetical protein